MSCDTFKPFILVQGMVVSFAKNVANFISSIEKDHVVILSSLDSGKRRIIDASR